VKAASRSSGAINKYIQLAGNSSLMSALPSKCSECGCKEFYKQSDFKRSLGVFLVGVASLATCVLMYMGYNWFIIWSPMFVVLIFDFALFRSRPVVAICYQCKHIFRGIPPKALEEIEGFDLEIHDRYKYVENQE